MKYDYLFHLPTINSNNFFFFLTLLCSEKLRAFSITLHSCSIADTPGGQSFKMFHGTGKNLCLLPSSWDNIFRGCGWKEDQLITEFMAGSKLKTSSMGQVTLNLLCLPRIEKSAFPWEGCREGFAPAGDVSLQTSVMSTTAPYVWCWWGVKAEDFAKCPCHWPDTGRWSLAEESEEL